MFQVFRIADLSRLPALNIDGRAPEEKEKRLSISCEFNTIGQLIVIIIIIIISIYSLFLISMIITTTINFIMIIIIISITQVTV